MFIFIIYLLAFLAAANLEANDKIYLHSDSAGFSVMRHGKKITLSREQKGLFVKVHPGANRFLVQKKGMADRNIVIWKIGQKMEKYFVAFAPYKVRRKLLPFKKAKKPLRKVKSVCQIASLKETCHRKTWLSDVFFSGYLYKDPKDKYLVKIKPFLLAKLPQQRKKGAETIYLAHAEKIAAGFPLSREAQASLAREALYRGDCSRVIRVLRDAYTAGSDSAHLWLSLGLCYERKATFKVADEFYSQIKMGLRVPATYYNYGRLLLRRNPVKGRSVLESCKKKWPSYYPCYELFAQTKMVLRKKPGDYKREYQKANLAKIMGFLKSLEKANGRKKEVIGKIEHFRRAYRVNGEPLIALALYDRENRERYKYLLKQAHYSSPAYVQKSLAALEKSKDDSLLENILEGAISSDKTSAKYWHLMADFYAQKKDCQKVLSTIKLAKKSLASMPPSFSDLEDRCLLHLGFYGVKRKKPL